MTLNPIVKPKLWFIYIPLVVALFVVITLAVTKSGPFEQTEDLGNNLKFCPNNISCGNTRYSIEDCGVNCRPGAMPVSQGQEPVYCCLENQDWERKDSGIGNGTYKEWEPPLIYVNEPNNKYSPDTTWYTITKDNKRCTETGYSCKIDETDVARGKHAGENPISAQECAKICKDDHKCLSFSTNGSEGNCFFNYNGVCGSSSDAKYQLTASDMSRQYPEACTQGWRYYIKQPLSPDKKNTTRIVN